MIEPVTLAYVAGIIDGEGTIFISKGKPAKERVTPTYVGCLRVGNTDKRLIDFLHVTFGEGGVHERKMSATNANWKNCWMWAVTGPAAARAVRAVRPYLRLKGAQADLLLEFVDGFLSFERIGRFGVSPEEETRRENLRQLIRELNRKGPRSGVAPAPPVVVSYEPVDQDS